MTDVPAAEIAEARAVLEAELLPDEATILRPTEESDGGGGRVTKWASRGTVACRLDPYGGATSSRGAGGESKLHPAERLDTRIVHIVTVPAGTDVQLKDRLEINDATYEVNILRQRGEWELLRRVECKEVF